MTTLNSFLRDLMEGSEVSAVDINIVNDNATICDGTMRPSSSMLLTPIDRYAFGTMNRAQSLYTMVTSSSMTGGGSGDGTTSSSATSQGCGGPTDHLTTRWQNNISRALHSDSTLGKPKRRGSTDQSSIELWQTASSMWNEQPPSSSPVTTTGMGIGKRADTSLVPPSRSRGGGGGDGGGPSSERSTGSPSSSTYSSRPMQQPVRSSSDSRKVDATTTTTTTVESPGRRTTRRSSHTEQQQNGRGETATSNQQQQQRRRRSSGSSSLLASLGAMAPTPRRNSGQNIIPLPALEKMPLLQNVPQRPKQRLCRTQTPKHPSKIQKSSSNNSGEDEVTARTSSESTFEEDDIVLVCQTSGSSPSASQQSSPITSPSTTTTTTRKTTTSSSSSSSSSSPTATHHHAFPKSLRELPYSSEK